MVLGMLWEACNKITDQLWLTKAFDYFMGNKAERAGVRVASEAQHTYQGPWSFLLPPLPSQWGGNAPLQITAALASNITPSMNSLREEGLRLQDSFSTSPCYQGAETFPKVTKQSLSITWNIFPRKIMNKWDDLYESIFKLWSKSKVHFCYYLDLLLYKYRIWKTVCSKSAYRSFDFTHQNTLKTGHMLWSGSGSLMAVVMEGSQGW